MDIPDRTVTIKVNTRAVNSATKAVGGLADAFDRLPAGVGGNLGRDMDRARRSVGGLGDELGETSRRHRESSRDTDRNSDSVDGLGRRVRNTTRTVSEGADGLSKFGGSAVELGGNLNKLGGLVSPAVSGISMFGQAAAYAAAGSGILTAGVGALGAVSVGSFGAVGVMAGVAGAAMTEFTLDAHKDSARFGKTMEQMGRQSHLAAQYVSEPWAETLTDLGRSLVTADNHMTPAGMRIAQGLRGGFENASTAVDGASSEIVDAAGIAAEGVTQLTGQAGPGVQAFLKQLPALTQGTVDGLSQVTTEFGKSADMWDAGTPALNRMTMAVTGFGAELVSVGRQNLPEFAEDVRSMFSDTTSMTRDLAPAIRPSMSAFTDVVGAVTGGVGSLAPDITQFAQTVSRNAPQLESIVGSLGRGMLDFGGAAVDGLGMASPAIEELARTINANKGEIASTVGKIVTGGADLLSMGADAVGVFDKVDNKVRNVVQPHGQPGLWRDAPGIASSPAYGYGGGLSRAREGADPGSQLTPDGWRRDASLKAFPGAGKWATKGGGVPGRFSGAEVSWREDADGNVVPINGKGRDVSQAQLDGMDRFERYLKTPGLSGEQKSVAKSWQGHILAGNASPNQQTPTDPPGSMSAGWAAKHPQEFQERFPGRKAPANKREVAEIFPFIPGDPTSGQTGRQGVMAGTGPNFGPGQTAPFRTGAQPLMDQIQEPPAPPPVAQPQIEPQIGAAGTRSLRKQFTDLAPEVEQGGQNLGASMTQGMDSGITQNETKTINVTRKWMKKVVDVGAEELDSHSPSRKFFALGQSAPDGFSGGVLANQGGAVNATRQFMSGIVGAGRSEAVAGQRALATAGGQLAGGYSQVLGGLTGAGSDMGGFASQLNPSQVAGYASALNSYGGAMASASQAEADYSNSSSGGGGRLSGSRVEQLQRLGYNQATIERVLGRDAAHNTTRQRIMDQRADNRARAMGQPIPSEVRQNAIWDASNRRQSLYASKEATVNPFASLFDSSKKAQTEAHAGAFKIGQAVPYGAAAGVAAVAAAPIKPLINMAKQFEEKVKQQLGIKSPSKVFAGIGGDVVGGMAGGIGGAISGATGVVRGVANDGGLKIGLTYGTSFVDGVTRIIQKDLMQAVTPPNVESAAAKAALTASGLWAPAGGGASMPKTAMVAFGGGGGSMTVTVQNQTFLDSELIMSKVHSQTEEQIGVAMGDLNTLIKVS